MPHHRKGIPHVFWVAQVKNKGDKFVWNNGTLLPRVPYGTRRNACVHCFEYFLQDQKLV